MPHLTALFLASVLFAGCVGGARVGDPASAGSPASDAQGQLFIIGGGDRPPSLTARMVEAAGLGPDDYVVILPMASSVPDSAATWSGESFAALGVRVAGLQFSKDAAPPPARLDSLRRARLIYIAGGDQVRFMDVVAGTPIEDAIHHAYRSGSLIAGTSAGAAVMSAQMLTGDQNNHPEYTPTYEFLEADNIDLAPGLGLLTGVIVDQHFLRRSRHNRLLTAVMEFPEITGIGIDESTAILVRGGRAEVVGSAQVLVFHNPDRSVTRRDGKLGARNLRVDVYLPGESFALDGR